ncbi:MAG TPA: FMN-binding protein [Porticoccaceae bacterium]|nr:FMN-binding protein [Gammaproteobacteria bacterium]HIL59676.1 FMN-binding protein [Porticoccaceae bacterium]
MKIINKCGAKLVLIFSAILVFPLVFASDDFISSEDFLRRVFVGEIPQSDTVWIAGEVKQVAEEILGHKPGFLRARYWGDAERSAWIIDEIGKTEPITIGIVVQSNQIEEVKVLAFRESRGWEIKYDFFTRQFNGVAIQELQHLSRSIDGISGATLSVRAMTNVSRLVLYLAKSLST